jgi:CHASE2 domain-containing sensor protein
MNQESNNRASLNQIIEDSKIENSQVQQGSVNNGNLFQIQIDKLELDLLIIILDRLFPERIQNKPTYSNRRKAISIILASCIAYWVTTGIRSLGSLEFLEISSYDLLTKLKPSSAINSKLLIVEVDDEDIKNPEFKKPLGDSVVTRLLRRVNNYEPKVIGLGISREEPTPNKEDWNTLGSFIQSSSSPIVAVCSVGEVVGTQPLPAKAPPPNVLPDRLGFADGLMIDSDGLVRRYSLGMDYRKSLCLTPYSFSLQVVKKFLPPETTYNYIKDVELKINSAKFPVLSSEFGGYHRLKDHAGYQLMVHYYPIDRIVQKVSLTYIMSSHTSDADMKQLIKDRIVLIGYNVKNTKGKGKGWHKTAIGDMPSIRIHAQVVNQILNTVQGSTNVLSSWSNQVENIWIFAWCGIGAVFIWRSQSLIFVTGILIISSLTLTAVCLLQFSNTVWIPLVPAIIGLWIATTLTSYFIRTNISVNIPLLVQRRV